ncbi:hypothetical protein B0T22DRAFT_375485 [Podospora appendiculata]|uniref:Zn(2)-C6 fungal-type domain-containing protein n=1 Tax=Podospora appendiculata TaxID=314037 RepID=A0AAE0XCW4_9PEZI|nr:hypothetical protein B0T22DRAFT_375485 [Podospora appendiculata]
MVYNGKPSRGCQVCRTRRIKCDESKPTCNQCAKSRRQCPGYKDDFDLVLRNETSATQRRAQKAGSKKAAALAKQQQKVAIPSSKQQLQTQAQAQSHALIPILPNTTDETLFTLPAALHIPLETRAACNFVSNFVLMPRQDTDTIGFMDYLIPLLKTSPDGHLHHAFNACALALLSNRGDAKDASLPARALGEYTKALSATNAALRDPVESKTDAVLAAVLLLGMFENITARRIGDFAWGSHIEGAIQLVKARGRKQIRTKTGLQLFIAVRTQLIVHGLTSAKAPIMGSNWWLSDAVFDPAASACQGLSLKTSELRSEITNRMLTSIARTPGNISTMLALMRRAQSLDMDVSRWMLSVPASYRYTTYYHPFPPSPRSDSGSGAIDYASLEIFPGNGGAVHMYPDLMIATVWNLARTTRLILASLTVRCAAWICSPVDYRTTPEYAACARASAETIDDILAGVPCHLGWRPPADAGGGDRGMDMSLGSFACGGRAAEAKGLAGYLLTWPLAIVIAMDFMTAEQRAWCKGRLGVIADQVGIRYARILQGLDVRIPSMLIRRDGLMASPFPGAHDFEKMLSEARGMAPGVREAYIKGLMKAKEDLMRLKAGTEDES